MKKININVRGMHCKSCELLLEKSLKKAKNITAVSADERKGTVELSYTGSGVDHEEIRNIIEDAGYQIGKKGESPWLNKDKKVYTDMIFVLFSLLAIYLVFSALGIDLGGFGNFTNPTFGVALIVGLTAGISSCMALVGGLVLGVSAKWSEDNKNLSKLAKFQPHIYFNIGRIVGFAFFGGILGLFGQIFSLSPFVIGLMTLVTGLVMLFLGVNLSEISPKISSLSITLPKSLGRNVGKNSAGSKHMFAMTTGALTFFLPCGFTLAMQAYAITTGNFVDGALIMMAFAIGTAPGLLGVGGLSSAFSGNKAKKFFKATGVMVIILSIFNISNGYTLMSLSGGTDAKGAIEANPGEIQTIRMVQAGDGYSPNELHIKPNTKTKWIIESTNPFSCATQLIAPSIGVNMTLVKGENVVEFISPASGEIKFSCSMGMYGGRIIIDGDGAAATATDNGATTVSTVSSNAANNGATGGAGGCAMMGGGSRTTTTTTPSAPIAGAEQITATYTSNGMSPNSFDLEKGKNYTLTIDVKDTIYGCMRQILIPSLDENIQSLDAGTKVVFNIRADKTGEFPLICAMGVPHGYINIR